MNRKAYPSDVSDDEWAFVAPHLTLMTEDAPQRTYPLREMFNALRWLVRAGACWRMLLHDLPRGKWSISKPNAGYGRAALKLSSMTCVNCCALPRGARHSPQEPSSLGGRCKARRRAAGVPGMMAISASGGWKVHMAVDMLGHLLALLVTPANEQERAQVVALA